MKNNKSKILKTSLIMLAMTTLLACGPIKSSSSSLDSSGSETTSDVATSDSSSQSSTSTSEDNSSSSSSEEDIPTSSETPSTSEDNSSSSSEITPPQIVSLDVVDQNHDYKIGDKYKELCNLKFVANLDNDTYLDISNKVNYRIKKILPPNNGNMVASHPFSYAGRHLVYITFIYDEESYNKVLSVEVKSGFDVGFKAKSLKITNTPKAYINSLFIPSNELTFDVTWDNGFVEHITYNKDHKGYEINLYETGDISHTNLINEPIVEGKEYTFEIKIVNSEISIKEQLEVLSSYGFIKLDELSMTCQTLKSTYSTPIGKLNVLVIPVELDKTGFYDAKTWTSKDLERTKKEMFGSKEDSSRGWNSLKSYYETSSYGQLEISGMVADIYEETDPNLTMQAINNDGLMNKLYSLYRRALDFTMESHPEVDWSEYDLNNDGCFDAVHIITNCGKESVKWADTLWPHFAQTNEFGTHEKPTINSYSLSSLGHFDSARTQVHEQGHMLGLQDYYDYTPNGGHVDYIGGFDMQDMNLLDWNAFSKMEVGWLKPYVIDGTQSTATVTLSPVALNGDCLVIPANFNTYNQSAFDEYFLIELITPVGNHGADWDYLYDAYDVNVPQIHLGDYGVRMYHVDARLWGYNDRRKVDEGREIHDITELNNSPFTENEIGCNNSKDATAYSVPCPTIWHNFKLLTLLQAGKVDTFSKGELLHKEDLFHEGDVFKFEDYDHFLSKSGKPTSTMDNGEVFPYTIKFKEMNKNKVVIEVSMD